MGNRWKSKCRNNVDDEGEFQFARKGTRTVGRGSQRDYQSARLPQHLEQAGHRIDRDQRLDFLVVRRRVKTIACPASAIWEENQSSARVFPAASVNQLPDPCRQHPHCRSRPASSAVTFEATGEGNRTMSAQAQPAHRKRSACGQKAALPQAEAPFTSTPAHFSSSVRVAA
jgi:hypothetical protein